MSARRLTSMTLASLCALAVGLLLPAAQAQAGAVHEYLSSIPGVPVEGPHGEPVPLPGPFSEGHGMAVDAGELYVADQPGGESRLDKFNASTGAFISQFAQLPPRLFDFRQSVAVGHGTGETEVYDVGDESGVPREKEGMVAVIGASGALQGVWKGEDTPGKSFGCFECAGPGGVAVDNSANPLTTGDVYVSVPEQGVVDVFEPKAGGGEKYLRQLPGPEPELNPEVHFKGLRSVAVSSVNGDVVVVDGETVDVFEPTLLEKFALVRRLTGTPAGPFNTALAHVAVDGNGDIYVSGDGEERKTVYQFSAEGVFLGLVTGTPAGPFITLRGLAVDPATHRVYAGARVEEKNGEEVELVDVFGPTIVVPDVVTEPASNLRPGSATLNGSVNPDNGGEAKCRFVWGTSKFFGKEAPCEPEAVADGASPVPVHAALGELQPDTTYYYRLQATNTANGRTNPGEPSQDQEFTTTGPGMDGESASSVTATSVTLDASINPHNLPTTYFFQYGTSVSYGADAPGAPGASIGSGEGDAEVARHVQGLLAGTIYHYRVVTVSEAKPGVFEVFEGPDQTFTTQPVGSGFVLPDGRQWEMVSPPNKHGAPIGPPGPQSPGVTEASVNGDAISYLTGAPPEAEPQGYAQGVQNLARRGPGGWESRDIASHHGQGPTGKTVGYGEEYRFFSEDLSLGIVEPYGSFDPSLSPEASELTSYLRKMYLNGNVNDPCLESCYRPLATGKAGYANVPPGTVIDPVIEGKKCFLGPACGPVFEGATPDLSHIAFESRVALTSEGEGEEGLYEWTGGKLTFVGKGHLGTVTDSSARHAISEDGSRVIFTGQGNNLFMRDTAGGKTGEAVQLNVPQGGSGRGQPIAYFQDASSDGSKVLFTAGQQLTKDGAHNGTNDLYQCEMVVSAGKLQCDLSDLTPVNAEGEPAKVLEGVLGASEDGSYVYFVANGVQAEGAVHGTCQGQLTPFGATCNLYVRHGGVTKLVAVLSGADNPDWRETLADKTARVSPNGEWLAFMSRQDLTGYVTRDAVSGQPDEEVYLYNARSGRLVCASCNPSGARPVGFELGGGNRVFDFQGWDPHSWLAANIPVWSEISINKMRYQSRYLSDSGRLFFNSNDALVPQDVNGAEDVYQYEPPGVGPGVGNCSASSATFSERSGGCIGLISSGTSGEESAFLDASGSGGDVFFLTAARLSPQDVDTAMDIYDAHECTAGSPCFPAAASLPPPCDTGDACKPSPTPQPAIFGSPSSATFSGAGNIVPSTNVPAVKPRGLTRAQQLARALRACRKKRGRARAVCERRARARYAKQSRKADNARKRGSGR